MNETRNETAHLACSAGATAARHLLPAILPERDNMDQRWRDPEAKGDALVTVNTAIPPKPSLPCLHI